MSGSTTSGWDACRPSLGSVTLATPTSQYFTFISIWQHISWGPLISVSSPHPSMSLYCLPPKPITKPSIPLSPILTSLPYCISPHTHTHTLPKYNLTPNVSHFQVLTLHQANCMCWEQRRENNHVTGSTYRKWICFSRGCDRRCWRNDCEAMVISRLCESLSSCETKGMKLCWVSCTNT